VYVLHEGNAVRFQDGGRGRDIVRLEVEMEMLTPVDEGDRGILLIHEFEMENLTACPNAGVELLILEVELQPEFGRVKADRRLQIGGAQLWNEA
jgi:hypothetical protein